MITTKIDVSKSTITQSVIDELMSKGEVQLFSSEPLTEQERLDEEQLSMLNTQIPPNEYFNWSNIRGSKIWQEQVEKNLWHSGGYVMGSDPVRTDEAADTQPYNWQLKGRENQIISPVESAYSQQWHGLTTENHLYNAISCLPSGETIVLKSRRVGRKNALAQQFKEDAEKLYDQVFAIENDKNLQSE